MKNNKKMSLYQLINEKFEEYPRYPYIFQNIKNSGKYDFEYMLWTDEISVVQKKEHSSKVIKLLKESIEKNDTSDVVKYIKEYPVRMYMKEIRTAIRLELSEHKIQKEKWYKFALRITKKSLNDELIKLGIFILGEFDNDISRKIILTFGYFSEFTMYAIEAMKYFEDCNEIYFDMMQKTSGYGKLALMNVYKPVLDTSKKWLFENTLKYQHKPNIATTYLIKNIEMYEYFNKMNIDKKTFDVLSKIIAYGLEYNYINESYISYITIDKYLSSFKLYSADIYSLCAIVNIFDDMKYLNCEKDEEKYEIKEKWTDIKRKEISDKCYEIIKGNKKEWISVIRKQLFKPEINNHLIIKILQVIKYCPEFSLLNNLLSIKEFDLDVLEFLLSDNYKIYANDVREFLLCQINLEALQVNPMDVDQEEFSTDYLADLWLLELIKVMKKIDKYDEYIYLKGLFTRISETRIEALRALKKNKEKWSEKVKEKIIMAIEMEPVWEIKKKMHKLINPNKEMEKVKRQIEVFDKMDIAKKDSVVLMETEVAEVFCHDLSVAQDDFDVDDRLYLVRERDNEYDENAIMVVTKSGYVIGYIPKKYNYHLAAVIDEGIYMDAICTGVDFSKGIVEIELLIQKVSNYKEILYKFEFRVRENKVLRNT